MKRFIILALCFLSIVPASAQTDPEKAQPDTVSALRARAHKEIVARDAIIAQLQQKIADQQKQIDQQEVNSAALLKRVNAALAVLDAQGIVVPDAPNSALPATQTLIFAPMTQELPRQLISAQVPKDPLPHSLILAAMSTLQSFGSNNQNSLPPLGKEHNRDIIFESSEDSFHYLRQKAVSASILDYDIEKTASLTSPLIATVNYQVIFNESGWCSSSEQSKNAPFTRINKTPYQMVFAYKDGRWIIQSDTYNHSQSNEQARVLSAKLETEKIANERYTREHGNPPDGDPSKRNPHMDNILAWIDQLLSIAKEDVVSEK